MPGSLEQTIVEEAVEDIEASILILAVAKKMRSDSLQSRVLRYELILCSLQFSILLLQFYFSTSFWSRFLNLQYRSYRENRRN